MSSAREIERRLVKGSTLKGLVTPNYEGYGLSDVIPTIFKGFGIPTKRGLAGFDSSFLKGAKNIVLLCVDGLGYHILKKTKMLVKMEGFPLTSVLPSTTSTALSTLASGLTPQEHGIVGFWVYFKELGDVVSTLRFGPASSPGGYEEMGILPEIFFPVKTAYETLAKKGVKSFIFNRQEYINSGISQMMYRGCESLPYRNLTELFAKAKKTLEKRGRKFIYLYWDMIDVTAHMQGEKSKEFSKQIALMEGELERFLGKIKDCLFLLTADHGHLAIPLRRQKSFLDYPDLLANLACPPTGESRVWYLFAKKGREKQVREYLKNNFSKRAFVFPSGDLLKRGFFGRGKPLKETRDRIGDFTLIAKKDFMFTYPYLEGRGAVSFHGGLSKEEMLVPFLWRRF